jgi:uncharacterized protein YcgI (DUF1989 family)
MRTGETILIEPRSAISFPLLKTASIRIIDVEGMQVADLVAFNKDHLTEKLSTGVTIDCNSSVRPTTGDRLFSSQYREMFTIIQDMVGYHDLLHPPCSTPMYRLQYDSRGEHPNCLQNLAHALSSFGIGEEDIPGPINIFMHSVISTDGRVRIEEPLSRSGDFIELRAKMDLIVAVSACSVEESACNGYSCTSIKIHLLKNQ